MAFTTKDPKNTYLAILNLGDANEVLHATIPEPVLDAAGTASLLELSQNAVFFTGIMEADVASGFVMDAGIDFTSDAVITDILKDKTDTDVGIHFTAGDPEASLSAKVGSIALRRDGSAGATMYVKETGVGNTGWSAYDLIAAFLDLSDTPGTFTADKWLKVNGGGSLLEWVDAPATDFADLADTPANFSGAGGKTVRVNSAPDALEFVDSDFLNLTDTPSSYTGYGLIAVNGGGTALVEILAAAVQGDVIHRGASSWSNLGPGSDGDVLTTHGAAADPTWTTISGSGLPASVQGAIIYYNGSNWVALTPGSSGQYLKTLGGAANPAWDDVDAFPATPAQGEIVYYNGAAWANLGVGTEGKVLTTHSTSADPTWETPVGGATDVLDLDDTPSDYSSDGDIVYTNGSDAWQYQGIGFFLASHLDDTPPNNDQILIADDGGSVGIKWADNSFFLHNDGPGDPGGNPLAFMAVNTGEDSIEYCCEDPGNKDVPQYDGGSGNWEAHYVPRFYVGSGSPENGQTADVGDFYTRDDGSTVDILYVKATGDDSDTGWALVTSTTAT